MAVPKKKTSQSKRDQRRAHDALGKTNVAHDQVTGGMKRRHHISFEDGHYRGRLVTTAKVNA